MYWSTHPPGNSYPWDSNQIGPNSYLTTGYSNPGVIEEFNRAGTLLWRYQPRPGDANPNHPSLALPLPNGDVLANDDFNHRVVEIDPHTNEIVWHYGHTRTAGRGPGYLNDPDGVDLAPLNSLAMRRSPTMDTLPGTGEGREGSWGRAPFSTPTPESDRDHAALEPARQSKLEVGGLLSRVAVMRGLRSTTNPAAPDAIDAAGAR